MEWLSTYWPLLLIILAALFWQNCVHEFSHLVAVWKYERKKPLGFYPYPHWHKGKFYFARFKCEPYRAPGHPMVYMAPIPGASIQGVLATVVFVGIRIGTSGPSPLWFFWTHLGVTMVPVVDMLWWLRSYVKGSEHSDGKRYRRAWEALKS